MSEVVNGESDICASISVGAGCCLLSSEYSCHRPCFERVGLARSQRENRRAKHIDLETFRGDVVQSVQDIFRAVQRVDSDRELKHLISKPCRCHWILPWWQSNCELLLARSTTRGALEPAHASGHAGQDNDNPGLGTKEDCAQTSAVDEIPA